MTAERARIAAALAAIEVARDALQRALDEDHTDPPLIDEDLMPLGAAAQRLGKAKETVRRWIKRHDLGHRIGGRWYVSEARIRRFTGRR